MNEAALLMIGCAVTFIFAVGGYFAFRASFAGELRPDP